MHSRQTLRQSSSLRPLYQSTSPRQIALPRRSLAIVKSLDCQTRLTGLCLGKRQKMTTAAAAASEQAALQRAHNHKQKHLSYTAYEGNSWQATLPATGRHCRACTPQNMWSWSMSIMECNGACRSDSTGGPLA